MRSMTWSGAVLATALTTAALAGAAQAAPSWQCGASAATTSLAGNEAVNPVTSSTAPCVSNQTGAQNLAAPAGVPEALLTAPTASATTTATPEGAIPAYQSVSATARVENLALRLPPGAPSTTLGVRVATATASGTCRNGRPALSGTSEAPGLTLGGQELPVEQVVQQLAAALAPLGQVVDLKTNEQARDATSLTQRALHLRILAAGGTPVLDVVAGEARVGWEGTVCDPAGQIAGGGSEGSGARNSAESAGSLANGLNGGRCAHLAMYFVHNHKRSLASRFGRRVVTRGRIVNCKGKSIVRARVDVIHVVKGKRRLVKTGLRSREGGKLTLILPLNLRTRDIRFEYRGSLRSSKVTSRSTLHLKVRNRRGRMLR